MSTVPISGVRLVMPGLVVALVLTGCTTSEARSENYGLAQTPALTDLDDGAWVADNIEDPDVSLVPGSRITINFGDDESLAADAGCNTMRGKAVVDGDELVVSALASTQKACEDALAQQDNWLSEFLSSRPAIERLDQDLWLTRGDTTVHLVQD